MIRKSMVLMSVCLALPLQAEILGSWPADDATALAPSNIAPRKILKIASDKTEFSVQLMEDLTQWPRVQIGFRKPYKLNGGTRCRFSIEMKANQEIELNACIMRGKAPYQPIPKSWKICRLKPEYRTFSHEFVLDKDYDVMLLTPLLNSTTGKAGTKITIRKVTFEIVDGGMLPLPATPKWTLFAKPGIPKAELQKLAEIPETLGSAKAQILSIGNTFIEIPGVPNEKDESVLMTIIDSPADGQMQAGFSADWWAEIYVNGSRCASTLDTGNVSHKFVPEDNVFNFKVKKGKNLLVAYVKSGMKGGKFAFGSVKYRHKLSRVTEIVRGKEWRPTKMNDIEWNSGTVPPPPGVSMKQWRKEFLIPKRIDQLQIIPGSVLDISQYVPKHDIDKLGFLTVDPEGHVVSSVDPSIRVKLRGFNFYMPSAFHGFYRTTHKDLEDYAEAIHCAGMNIVRLQHVNRFLLGFGALSKPKPGTVKDPKTPEEIELDKESVDRVDYFLKCLRDRNIYVIADLVFFATGWSKLKLDSKEDGLDLQLLAGNPKKRKHYAAGFRYMMNHVNPYTGRKLKDDPQLMAITFYNEIEHIFADKKFPLFDKPFKAWCKEKNLEVKKPFDRALLLDETSEGDAAREFILEKIDRNNEFLFGLAREEGYRGFVTMYDMFVRHLCGWGRRNYNAVAMHSYHAHPERFKPLMKLPGFKQKLRYGTWYRNKMAGVRQETSITTERNYIAKAAVSRVLNKPFFLTEYAHTNYNQYTQEGGISVGAYAALQDWDMLIPHENCVRIFYSPMPAGFEEALSMTQRAGRMLTAFLWQRGDAAPAKKSINLNIPEKTTRSKNILGSIGSGHNALFMISKIGSSYDGKQRGDFQFTPTKFTGVHYKGMYVVQAAESRDQIDQLEASVKELKQAGVIPADNRTDVQKGIFESETGEILADTKKHTLSVVTPRTESLALKPGQSLKGKQLSVLSASVPVTVSAISIDGTQPVANANHLLLFVQTMSVAEHTVFSTENFDFEIDCGGLKTMERAGQFKIRLKTEQKKAPKLYALNPNGSREKELPVVFKNGDLLINLDTSKLEYGTPFFELVY